eukprot:599994-Hanusia_phi.AAC.1
MIQLESTVEEPDDKRGNDSRSFVTNGHSVRFRSVSPPNTPVRKIALSAEKLHYLRDDKLVITSSDSGIWSLSGTEVRLCRLRSIPARALCNWQAAPPGRGARISQLYPAKLSD